MEIQDRRRKSTRTQKQSNIDSYEEERKKRRKKKKANRSVNRFILFLIVIILFYTLYGFIVSVFKKTVPFTVVVPSQIENVISTNAKILRDEKVIYSEYNGNVQYFYQEGDKIPKDSYVCKIYNSKTNSDLENKINALDQQIMKIQDKRKEVSFYKTDTALIDKEIDESIKKYYKLNGTNYNFNIYDLKSEIEGKLNLKNSLVIGEDTELTSTYRDKINTYQNQLEASGNLIGTDKSGILSFYIDGLENVQKPEAFANVFDKNQFNPNKIITSARKDTIKKGSAAFKIVDDYEWYVASKINNKYLKDFEVGKTKKIRFPKIDNSTIDAEIMDVVKKNDSSIVLFKLIEQCEDFLQFRDVNIEIVEEKNSGLEILNDSIIKKNVFSIPKDIVKNDNKKNYVIKKIGNSDNPSEINIFYEDNDNVYVSTDDNTIRLNDKLIKNDKTIMKIEKVDSISGVYIIIGNIAKFKKVEVIGNNDKYSVVADNPDSVRVYDNVINNPKDVKDNGFIK